MDQQQVNEIFRTYFKPVATPKLRPDGLVDVIGDLCTTKKFEKLPLRFHTVSGLVDVGDIGLTTLEGSPVIVQGKYFDCSYNYLHSLHHAPQKVQGTFSCVGNDLRTLEGAPQLVLGEFNCSANAYLNSLEGLPDVHSTIVIPARNGLGLLRVLLASHTSEIKLSGNLWWEEAEIILNKYRGKGWNAMVPCARELIRAGYKSIAHL